MFARAVHGLAAPRGIPYHLAYQLGAIRGTLTGQVHVHGLSDASANTSDGGF